MIQSSDDCSQDIINICKQNENPEIKKFSNYHKTLLYYKAKLKFLSYIENNETLGFLCYAICKNHLTMYAIATLVQYRRKGIGTMLFNQMIDDAKQMQKSFIKWKATQISLSFYTNMGIQPLQSKNEQYEFEYNIKSKSLLSNYGG